MNGHPVWYRPARTKSYEPIVVDQELDNTALLAEAASLVRAAIRRGLIKEAPVVASAVGPKSELAICESCGCEFTRDISAAKKQCSPCRLPEKTCTFCGKNFKPTYQRQVTCGEDCRRQRLQAAASGRRRTWLNVPCENCGMPFEKAPASPRKNCSQQCGFASMVRNIKKPKTKRK